MTVPEELWTVVDGMHEPIITQEEWDRAQEKLAVRKRCDNHGAQQIFAGLAKCADCGYALNYTYNKGNPRYQCSLYSTKGKGHCASHFITYADLYDAVLCDIQRRAKAAARMDAHLLARLSNEASGLINQKAQEAEREKRRMDSRISELDAIIAKLYEDGALGRIPQERAQSLMDKFEGELKELKAKCAELTNTLNAQAKRQSEMEMFTQVLAGYQDLQELNATILNELIREIRVGVKYTEDGVKKQKIQILYKHACYVDYFADMEFTLSDGLRVVFKELDEQLPLAV